MHGWCDLVAKLRPMPRSLGAKTLSVMRILAMARVHIDFPEVIVTQVGIGGAFTADRLRAGCSDHQKGQKNQRDHRRYRQIGPRAPARELARSDRTVFAPRSRILRAMLDLGRACPT